MCVKAQKCVRGLQPPWGLRIQAVLECLGWSHDRCKMSHIDLVVQLDGELVDTEDQLQGA